MQILVTMHVNVHILIKITYEVTTHWLLFTGKGIIMLFYDTCSWLLFQKH